MRIRARHLRLAVQTIFLIGFVALFWGLAFSPVPGRVASSLLALDPLTSVGSALADWTVPGWAWLGVAVLTGSAVLGRFFCGWMCPLGTLQQLASWIAGPNRRARAKLNRYRRWFAVKYVVLTVLLVWAVVGTSHVGWLAPLSLLHRAVASGLQPLWKGWASPGGWFGFGLLAAILLLSTWMPRLYCRALCPTGALLGVVARAAPATAPAAPCARSPARAPTSRSATTGSASATSASTASTPARRRASATACRKPAARWRRRRSMSAAAAS